MDVKRKRHGTFDGTDMRGKHAPANKTNDHTVEYKTAHSFPKVDSYYARKKPTPQFLPQGLSIRKKYKLYKEKCQEDNKNQFQRKCTGKYFAMITICNSINHKRGMC